MTTPLITVLMAVQNGGNYLDAAVASILQQTFVDFEFLIVDDGSTDETPQRLARLSDPRIRVVRNDVNLGLTRSLNRGLALARGTLIARQDADDLSHPERLAAQVEFLQRHPDVVVLGTQGRYIDARGRARTAAPWPKSTSDLGIRWQLCFDGPFIHTSVMFRKDVVWHELGGYDESFVTSQDYDLWTRVNARGYLMSNLAAALVSFRVHHGSVTTRHTVDRVARLRPVFLRTLVDQLGPDSVPAGWPEMWFRATYPTVFTDSGDPVTPVASAIDQIYQRFVAVHPAAAHDADIRRHRAAMLIRLANYAADRQRMISIRPFARACRLDPVMATQAAPRYIGHLLRLKSRRATMSTTERDRA